MIGRRVSVVRSGEMEVSIAREDDVGSWRQSVYAIEAAIVCESRTAITAARRVPVARQFRVDPNPDQRLASRAGDSADDRPAFDHSDRNIVADPEITAILSLTNRNGP